jgi:hypothetical protein
VYYTEFQEFQGVPCWSSRSSSGVPFGKVVNPRKYRKCRKYRESLESQQEILPA